MPRYRGRGARAVWYRGVACHRQGGADETAWRGLTGLVRPPSPSSSALPGAPSIDYSAPTFRLKNLWVPPKESDGLAMADHAKGGKTGAE
jgi:hypothetical protein